MVVDYASFEKLVESECLKELGQSLDVLPSVFYLEDYFSENLTVKDAKLKAQEFIKDLQNYLNP